MHVNVHNFCSVILQQMFIELKKKCSLAQSAHSRLSNVCKKKYQINLHSLICVRAADYAHKFSLLWSLHNFFCMFFILFL